MACFIILIIIKVEQFKLYMTKRNEIIPVILCGGSGSRLWPLSRESLPKQFWPLIVGSDYSLLQNTYERVKDIQI